VRRTLFAVAEIVGSTVGDLENNMSWAELLEWVAWFRIKNKEYERLRRQAEREARMR